VTYDFAATYQRWPRDREQLLDLLIPIYYGRVAGFVNQAREMTTLQAESLIEEQARIFEERKPHFLSRWDGPSPT
jgi:hypothetical protein